MSLRHSASAELKVVLSGCVYLRHAWHQGNPNVSYRLVWQCRPRAAADKNGSIICRREAGRYSVLKCVYLAFFATGNGHQQTPPRTWKS
jgi:hypothetical protein